jgi:methionyl-tRNA formyltransferase
MRLLFIGTSPFAVPSLRRLYESPEHDILAVVTQPDKPQGRGGKLSVSPVKATALEMGLALFQPEKVRAREFVRTVRDLAPEIIVVAAFGQIIPQRMLDIPPRGCINVHGSLLPRWRGAAPMQYALMAGDAETGVTTMMMDAGLDTGDILQRASLSLNTIADLGELETKLAEVGADLLMRTLAAVAAGDCPRVPQDERLVTLAPSLPPDIGALDWARPAEELHNLVRGVTPKPGAYVFVQGKRLKIWRTEVADAGRENAPGTVGTIETLGGGGITVKTSRGMLRLREVQPESKGRMAADAWARGARLVPGQTLE